MALAKKNLGSPDEKRPFQANGYVEVVTVDGVTVGRGRFEPGWQWSKHIKPLAGGESCQADHTGVCLSGRMRIKMNDGAETEIGPGDAFRISPGHDAWTVGSEACVILDWTGIAKYAKKS